MSSAAPFAATTGADEADEVAAQMPILRVARAVLGKDWHLARHFLFLSIQIDHPLGTLALQHSQETIECPQDGRIAIRFGPRDAALDL